MVTLLTSWPLIEKPVVQAASLLSQPWSTALPSAVDAAAQSRKKPVSHCTSLCWEVGSWQDGIIPSSLGRQCPGITQTTELLKSY